MRLRVDTRYTENKIDGYYTLKVWARMNWRYYPRGFTKKRPLTNKDIKAIRKWLVLNTGRQDSPYADCMIKQPSNRLTN